MGNWVAILKRGNYKEFEEEAFRVFQDALITQARYRYKDVREPEDIVGDVWFRLQHEGKKTKKKYIEGLFDSTLEKYSKRPERYNDDRIQKAIWSYLMRVMKTIMQKYFRYRRRELTGIEMEKPVPGHKPEQEAMVRERNTAFCNCMGDAILGRDCDLGIKKHLSKFCYSKEVQPFPCNSMHGHNGPEYCLELLKMVCMEWKWAQSGRMEREEFMEKWSVEGGIFDAHLNWMKKCVLKVRKRYETEH